MTRVDWNRLQSMRRRRCAHALELFEGVGVWAFPVVLDEFLSDDRATAELALVWEEVADAVAEPERARAASVVAVLGRPAGRKPPTDDPELTAQDPRLLRTLLSPSTVRRLAADSAGFPFQRLEGPFVRRCLGVPHHRAWVDGFADFRAAIQSFGAILREAARQEQGLIIGSA